MDPHRKPLDEFPKARFLNSYAHFAEIPHSVRREYAVVGRSNVGKSSFINHVFGDRRLARVSSTPGKTRLANFFECTDNTLWVDLPGYGYARAGGDEKQRWAGLIHAYCVQRENLMGIIWLLDIRHPGIEQDLLGHQWLQALGRPVLPVLTKTDKLSRSACNRQVQEFDRVFGFSGRAILYSINDKSSQERFWKSYIDWKASGAR